jgi:hypothetical protein
MARLLETYADALKQSIASANAAEPKRRKAK